jgi:hypothetical protein
VTSLTANHCTAGADRAVVRSQQMWNTRGPEGLAPGKIRCAADFSAPAGGGAVLFAPRSNDLPLLRLAADVPCSLPEAEMKSLMTLVLGLTVASFGVGLGVPPATRVWAGQAAGHDHTQGTTPDVAPFQTSTDRQKMSAMQQDMMAHMAALDDQLKTLGAEMNSAGTVDAKLDAITKALNVLIEQRSMMRMQMQMEAHSKMMR